MEVRMAAVGLMLGGLMAGNIVPSGASPDSFSRTADAPSTAGVLRAVPFTDVKIRDAFWAPRQETNRTVSIPHSLEMLKQAGNLHDLELAAEGAREGYIGPVFIDSDLYKAVEAASYSLAAVPDPRLEQRLDGIITKIAAAQQPDGYLNTWFTVREPEMRWTNLRDQHELYCAGHLIEAAVAHHAATGKRTLLDVAIRFADYIDSVFGDAPGKRMGYPGHEEIELALLKLWQTTGEQRYFDLSRFFLESRGHGFFAKEHGTDPAEYNGEYWQDNVPLRGHRKMVGHAVRAAYLMSAATDYAAATGDPALLRMLERVWHNTTGANMYVTGGIGSSAHNEGFTEDFDLPNFSAYQETCASVAMVMWNHRLNLLSGNARYADFLERTLFNGFLAGVSLDGTRFFYVNPLAGRGTHHRQEWYGCACCPPNVTRTLAQLGGYAYAASPGALWVNLYVQSSVDTKVAGRRVELDVTTNYPWDGQIRLKPRVEKEGPFELRLRVPEWAEGETLTLNGRPADGTRREKGYLVLGRDWKAGDEVTLNLPMPAFQVAADPRVKENTGRLALQRGPLVYCLEGCDHETPVHEIALPAGSEFQPEWVPDLLGGVTVIRGAGRVPVKATGWGKSLYAPAEKTRPVPVSAIPYYAWDNRTAGDMAVWIPTAPPPAPVSTPEERAEVRLSFAHTNCQPEGCRDGVEPQKSSDQPAASCHWWPHKGSEEWVEYSWKESQRLRGARVYWFDDTGRGECRLPAGWRLEYRERDSWKPVRAAGPFEVAADRWCDVDFEPVNTSALRLIVHMREGYAAGVHEWQLLPDDGE